MWTQQHRSFTIIALSGLSLSNALLVFGLFITMKVTPEQVLQEVKQVQSELNITTETTRQAISLNRDEIDRLRGQMKTRTEQLKRANEALLKLDPEFKVDPVEDFTLWESKR